MIATKAPRCELQYNGEIIQFRYGLMAVSFFSRNKVSSPSPFFDEKECFTICGIAAVLQAGYNDHCIVKQEEVKFQFADFMELIDGYFGTEQLDEIRRVIEAFTSSPAFTTTIEQINQQEKKDKQ